MKKKCRFVTKCCLLGTVSGLLIIFALSISGFFAFKIFNEMKEDCYVNVSGELNPKENLAFFPSTEKMNWFEANRVILHFFQFSWTLTKYPIPAIDKMITMKNARAWVSMVSYLKGCAIYLAGKS